MNEGRRKRRRRSAAVVALSAIAVLYVLSIGPATDMMVSRGWYLSKPATDLFFTVYAPLKWACRACPRIDEARQWYVELWITGRP